MSIFTRIWGLASAIIFLQPHFAHAQTMEETVGFLLSGAAGSTSYSDVKILDRENCIVQKGSGGLFNTYNWNNVLLGSFTFGKPNGYGYSLLTFNGRGTVVVTKSWIPNIPYDLGPPDYHKFIGNPKHGHWSESEKASGDFPVHYTNARRVKAALDHLYENFCTGIASKF